MADLKKLAQEIVGLTLLEAAELKTILKDEYGIEPAAGAVAVAAGPAASAAPAEAAEEQTEFDVILKAAGEKKINVIKVVRALTSLGLKEAKDVVETSGSTILTAVSKEAAQDAKPKLEAEGAQVEVK